MTNIYILRLTNNKYYIGKTNNPQKRILNHFQRQGSAWTKKYKPVRIEKIINNADDFDEDKWTIKYMKLYGIDNVRGGSFCSIQLSKSNKQTLQRMITGSSDCCYKCGQSGHYISQCPGTQQEEEEEDYEINLKRKEKYLSEVWCCEYCDKEFDSLKGCSFHENVHCKKKIVCYTCGEPGHYSSNCSYAQQGEEYTENDFTFEEYTAWCCEYFDKKFDSLKGCTFHENVHCKKKYATKKVVFADPNVRAAKQAARRQSYERQQQSQMALRRSRGW